MTKFNVNESEKNRIRKLHKNYSIIKEQQIDVEVDPVGVDPMGPDGPTKNPTEPIGGKGGDKCMELWVTKCFGPTDPGHEVGQSNLHFPCAKIDGQQPSQMHVGQKVKTINPGSPSVYVIDTVSSNYNSSASPALLTSNASCNPVGGQDQCQCCTAGGGAISMNGLVPAGTCSSYNSNTLSNCQVSPPQGTIQCGSKEDHCVNCSGSYITPIPAGTPCPKGSVLLQGTSPNFIAPCYECDGQGTCNGPGWFNGGPTVFNSQQDCASGAPGQPACSPQNDDHDCINGQCVATPGGGQYPSLGACQQVCGGGPNCAQLIPNFMATCDVKEANALAGGNGCNWICNKVNSLLSQQPFPNTAQGIRKQCKLDYVQAAANNVPCTNSNTGNCTSGNQSATVSQTFINSVTNHYNNQGCYGNQGSQSSPHPNSVCGRKAQFCAGSTPMEIAKCTWLTTFAASNGCNC